MSRLFVSTLVLLGGLALAGAHPAAAQLSAGVQVSWQWSDDGWRSGTVVDGYVHWSARSAYRDRAPARAYPVRRARLRIPPGHMPPAGLCRVWIVGLPPGHQPPPRPCTRSLFAYQGADMVILHTPRRDGRWWSPGPQRWRDADRWDYDHRRGDWDDDWDDRWDDDDWNDDDRWEDRGRRGRGGPPGRGRGGPPGRGPGRG